MAFIIDKLGDKHKRFKAWKAICGICESHFRFDERDAFMYKGRISIYINCPGCNKTLAVHSAEHGCSWACIDWKKSPKGKPAGWAICQIDV